MKAKDVNPSFEVALPIFRSGADLSANAPEQLELFHSSFGLMEKLTCLGLFALTDNKNKSARQSASLADLLQVLDYQRSENADGELTFNSKYYKTYSEIILDLYRHDIPLYIREYPKGRQGVVVFRLLQEVGFWYVDEHGKDIDLKKLPKEKVFEVAPAEKNNPPVLALRAFDSNGKPVQNEDGTPRRHPSRGFYFRWASNLIEAIEHGQGWYFYTACFSILKKYLRVNPTVAELIFYFIFAKRSYKECAHSKLIQHLGIKTKDKSRQEQVIKDALDICKEEGLIEYWHFRPAGYYERNKKTGEKRGGRPRRRDITYQWQITKKWRGELPGTAEKTIEVLPEGAKTLEGGGNGN